MPTSTAFIESPYTAFDHHHQTVTTGALRIDTVGIRAPVCNNEDSDTKFTPPLSPCREIPHCKCQIVRKQSLGSPPVSATQSWGHLSNNNVSPAAMFLARFAAASTPAIVEEQDGDEIDDYVLEKVIGHGGFSRVWSGYCASDGHKVAVKVVSATTQEQQEQQERELAIWKMIDHPNLVMLEKLLETDDKYYCVCTYCGGGSLLDKVNAQGCLTEDEARILFVELVQAVEYLHRVARVVHKDLKLDNIFLTHNGNSVHVKLGDFGLAVYQHQTNVEASGSLAYTSPEQIRSPWAIALPHTDMWSLGVCLYAMVAGRLPFNDTYDVRLQQKILTGHFDMPANFSPALAELVSGLLETDPQHRLTASQVLQSRWCTSTIALTTI